MVWINSSLCVRFMKKYFLIYTPLFLLIHGLLYLSYAHYDFQHFEVDFKFLYLMNLVFYLLGLLVAFLNNYFQTKNSNYISLALQEVYIITLLRVLVIGASAILYWLNQSHKVTLTDTLLGFALYFVYTFVEKYLQIKNLSASKIVR